MYTHQDVCGHKDNSFSLEIENKCALFKDNFTNNPIKIAMNAIKLIFVSKQYIQ